MSLRRSMHSAGHGGAAPPGRDVSVSVEQERLSGNSGIVFKFEALILVLVLLSLAFAGVDAKEQSAITAGAFFYAALVLAIRLTSFRRGEARWMAPVETWAMIPFVTWAIWFTDKLESPLRNVYLLVIIASALTSGMRTTMSQMGLIALCIVLIGEIYSVETLFSVGYLSALLAELTPLIVLASVISMFSSDIRYGMSKSKLLSHVDELTGLYNLRGFTIVADRLFGHALRHDDCVSALVINVDNFRCIDDTCGYEAGRTTLRAIAKCVETELRHNDVLARCGADEFVALLQETPERGALEVAERIRTAVAAISVVCEEKSIAATVSIGLASCVEASRGMNAVLAQAVRALQLAKQQGRNMVATVSN